MHTNEYYSKRRIALILSSALILYSILTTLSILVLRQATDNSDSLSFTPNFDKNYKSTITLTSKSLKKESTSSDTKYSLSTIEYDSDSLYLDWSEIEKEREKIAKAKREEEALRKAEELRLANIRKEEQRKSELGYIDYVETPVKIVDNKINVSNSVDKSNNTVKNNTTENKSTSINNQPSQPVEQATSLKTMGDSLGIPDIFDTSFKGYMCMHKVTAKSSKQWEFLHSGKFELSSNNHGLMMYKNYYIVAMASYYTNYKVGSTFRITLDSGITFDVITGDEKADQDTDSTHTFRPKGLDRGEIIEFIVACGQEGKNCNQYNTMSSADRRLGDLSSLGFQGNVVKVQKINDNEVVDALY